MTSTAFNFLPSYSKEDEGSGRDREKLPARDSWRQGSAKRVSALASCSGGKLSKIDKEEGSSQAWCGLPGQVFCMYRSLRGLLSCKGHSSFFYHAGHHGNLIFVLDDKEECHHCMVNHHAYGAHGRLASHF